MSASGKRESLYGKSLKYQTPQGTGMKCGPTSEFTLILKVKPGHADQLREDCNKFMAAVGGSDIPIKVGLHENRLSVFENGTRLLFATSFDGDMDVYVDDALLGLSKLLHLWARHCEGYPGTMDELPPDLDKMKEWTLSHFATSSCYHRTIAITVAEIAKGQRVNKAFQEVLDNPAAEKALQDPALKPLLDLASE